MCSTGWNSVLPLKLRSAHASLSAGIPAMQVCQDVCHLPGTSCAPHASFFSAPCASGFTLTCGQSCNIVQALVHATTLLPRPTCLLLDRTPSIRVGTVDGANVLGDVVLSLSHTRHHPRLVRPWVEVCL